MLEALETSPRRLEARRNHMVRKLALIAALTLSYFAIPTASQAYPPLPTCGTQSNPCPWVR